MPNLRMPPLSVQAFLHGMSLQSRFLLIIGTVTLLFVLAIWAVFNSVAGRVSDRIGVRFAEKQVLYDKSRTLQPLIREVALTRQMADSAIIKRWATNENDPRLRAAALAEMEKFRRNFQDRSYFLVLEKSGHFYFNNAGGEFAGKEMRYTMNPANQSDAWFYATIKSPKEYHINVDPDLNLGVTKVWVNMLLRDGDKVLGVIGTGLDLTDFIRNVADINQPGITNLFVDDSGAIQIYRDVKYIDYSSIAKSVDKRRSVDQLLERMEDRAWVREAVNQAALDNKIVPTGVVQIKGKSYLAGVAALPEVGWYDVTLLDLDVLLPQRDFLEIAVAVGGAVLGILLVLALTLRRQVLKPVAKLTDAAVRISQGDFAPTAVEGGGEVGQLASQFNSMTDSIQKARNWHEQEIAKQNRELGDTKKLLEVSLTQKVERRRVQDNLLTLMAHELRSPVAVIGNTAQMMNVLVSAEKPEWLPRINKIMGAVRQLAHLMDNVLAEERIGYQSSKMDWEVRDLNIFCDELRASQGAQRGRAIRFEPESAAVNLTADWQMIKIALRNLIDNAIKYSPPDSEVVVRVHNDGADAVLVEVQNDGENISPELRARIFEKFIRGKHAENVHGVGLGLFLVNWIAQLHGGRAEVESADGINTFRLVLPKTLK
jgi:signal transduction histidine kinase